jgi:hypothetical protein
VSEVLSIMFYIFLRYDNKSPNELFEIVFASDKTDGIRHRDIFKLIHPNFENVDKKEIIKAALMDYSQIKEAAATSSLMKKVLSYKDLKRCREAHEVCSILKRKNFVFKLQHLPNFALKSPEICELMIPNLSINEIISNLLNFYDKKLLKPKEPLSKKICNALQCSNKTIKDAKLNPVEVFRVMKELERKMTIEVPGLEKKISNPFILKKLMNVFNTSFNEYKTKTGCRFFITLNIKNFSKRREYNDKYKKDLFTFMLLL